MREASARETDGKTVLPLSSTGMGCGGEKGGGWGGREAQARPAAHCASLSKGKQMLRGARTHGATRYSPLCRF